MPQPIPVPDNPTSLHALRAMIGARSVLAALEVFHSALGEIFQLPVPNFNPIFMAGPEANRFLLTAQRDSFLWRPEDDPVAKLLRHGLLVEDGDAHDTLRRAIMPVLHKQRVERYAGAMLAQLDGVRADWALDRPVEMFEEMRKVALLILTATVFGVDFRPELDRLWKPILRLIDYISPGLWIFWPAMPRPRVGRARAAVDRYLYELIAQRRASGAPTDGLIDTLIQAGLDDDLIRDQLITVLIAGHDTSTAQLAWSLHLLAQHPDAQVQVRAEVDAVVGAEMPGAAHAADLRLLDAVISESLRLYPPIHLGSRSAAHDVPFGDYIIPQGARVMYSIYLTHRDPAQWESPATFDPGRFAPERARQQPAYSFLPFGGGPRNCIGMAFARLEAKLVLARLLQCYAFLPAEGRVRPSMGATLVPHPGVKLRLIPREARGNSRGPSR